MIKPVFYNKKLDINLINILIKSNIKNKQIMKIVEEYHNT